MTVLSLNNENLKLSKLSHLYRIFIGKTTTHYDCIETNRLSKSMKRSIRITNNQMVLFNIYI